MALTVLNSADVHSLFLSLDRREVVSLRNAIADVLREYSGKQQRPSDELGYRVRRQTVIRNKDGQDSVLMPLVSGGVSGFEIMTFPEGEGQKRRRRPVSVSFPRDDQSLSSRHSISSAPGSLGDSSSAPSPSMSEGAPVQTNSASGARSGFLTITDASGMPTALINTQDLIPFRSALCSMLLFEQREKVDNITIFGAGRLAFWHIRLAILLRGSHIKKVDIFNRSFDRASQLLRDIYSPAHEQWRSGVKFAAVSPGFINYHQDLKHSVTNADVIFCCTSSKDPLFPGEYLITSSPTRQFGQLVSAAGSCRPDMAELDPCILRYTTAEHRLQETHTPRGGMVVVDTLDSCMQVAGEIVQAGLDPLHLVEVGELMMVDELVRRGKSADRKLLDWIQKGDIIYKGVGLGVLDLVIGKETWQHAMMKRLGFISPGI